MVIAVHGHQQYHRIGQSVNSLYEPCLLTFSRRSCDRTEETNSTSYRFEGRTNVIPAWSYYARRQGHEDYDGGNVTVTLPRSLKYLLPIVQDAQRALGLRTFISNTQHNKENLEMSNGYFKNNIAYRFCYRFTLQFNSRYLNRRLIKYFLKSLYFFLHFIYSF